MLEFKVIRWKNLLSTGNVFTEIVLDTGANTLFIGENGAGKSTILDALCFALFGKAFRNINKPALINSVNDKNMVVEVEFITNGKHYKIIRGMKPNIFEIYVEGVLINQAADSRDYQEYLEKNILRVKSQRAFTQIVILGAASFTPFMQLTAAARREFIEDLLDIDVFSSMNAIVKARSATLKSDIDKNQLSITLTEEKKKVLERTLDNLRSSTSEKIADLKSQGRNQQKHYETLQAATDELIRKRQSYVTLGSGRAEAIAAERKKQSEISTLTVHRDAHKRDFDFYHRHDECPTCKQELDAGFKSNAITTSEEKYNSLNENIKKLQVEVKVLVDEIKKYDKYAQFVTNLDKDISVKHSEISSTQKDIQKIAKEIKALTVSDQTVIEVEQELGKITTELSDLEAEKKRLLEDKVYHDTAITLLKDGGIKTKIIKQYLPIINKTINLYLKKFGFMVNFSVNEKFEEVIKSRYQDEFSYNNFSEGEKARIDLALLLAWRTIAKMRNSVSTNILILDEVYDRSLDVSGTEELTKILKDTTNVIVISHTLDQSMHEFDRVFTFMKKGNFSSCTLS